MEMHNMSVLLVDDDNQALETMGMILEMDGFQVCHASSGHQALERLEKKGGEYPPVDLVVLDLEMANLSGIELLSELQRRDHSFPVMVVTGFASKKTVVELMRRGVVDYLDKPIQMEEFRNRVKLMAQGVLKRRKQFGAAPAMGTTTVDLSELSLPNSFRRRFSPPMGRDLALACRKEHGYDILIATMEAKGLEAFSQAVLIKSIFDKNRTSRQDGRTFLNGLNRSLLDGNFRKSPAKVLFLRINGYGLRLEMFSAGGAPPLFRDTAGILSQPLAAAGTDLGVTEEIRIESAIMPLARGDRFFLHTHGFDGISLLTPENSGEDLNTLIGNIWQEVLASSREGDSDDMFFSGIEVG